MIQRANAQGWQCLLLDLQDDAELIRQYREHHRAVPALVLASIRRAGIEEMLIYQLADRLVMMIRTNDDYDPEAKSIADAAVADVVAWERAMSRLQRPLSVAQPGEKWLPAELIFDLSSD